MIVRVRERETESRRVRETDFFFLIIYFEIKFEKLVGLVRGYL